MDWPKLDEIAYVSGRVATEEDINSGAAVFLLQSEGISIGSPIDMDIPQYAIHIGQDGVRSKVIIIQAESANNQNVIGAISVADGTFLAALLNEFDFLGTKKPNE